MKFNKIIKIIIIINQNLGLRFGLQISIYKVYVSVYNRCMTNEQFEKILLKQFESNYFKPKELMYSNSAGTFITPFEYKQYIEYIEKNEVGLVHKLPLKVFNHKCIYYMIPKGLQATISNYLDLVLDDFAKNSSFLSNRYFSELKKSRIYSEIEGTLNVESVPTTRKRLKELLEDNAPAVSKNDTIIKNMGAAVEYVESLPCFNKDNLFKLYSILSNECLDDGDELRPGDYYRYDSVMIDRYNGCDADKIDECMNSLFAFVNNYLNKKDDKSLIKILLPHICHYYLLYIHPYFDYNGRTARMVSYWVYLLIGKTYFPPVISEAINQTKSKYYRAIELSRDCHNDITYFFKYIFEISSQYMLCYSNLDLVISHAKNKGIILTSTEINYLKRIFVSYEGKFAYFDFLKMCNVEMSKQGALKVLNKFIECDALIECETKSKIKLFDINTKVAKYKMFAN